MRCSCCWSRRTAWWQHPRWVCELTRSWDRDPLVPEPKLSVFPLNSTSGRNGAPKARSGPRLLRNASRCFFGRVKTSFGKLHGDICNTERWPKMLDCLIDISCPFNRQEIILGTYSLSLINFKMALSRGCLQYR